MSIWFIINLQIASPFEAVWLVSISPSRIFLRSSVSTVYASQCFSATNREVRNREVRYLVGKDAVSIINARQKLSDKEFENWIKENLFKQKDSYTNDNCNKLE